MPPCTPCFLMQGVSNRTVELTVTFLTVDVTHNKMEWLSKQDEMLIDFVKSNECLYNIHIKEYRMAQWKKSLWQQIAESLNKTDVECSKRWAYIRDYYVRRRGKPGTGTCSEAAKKRSQLLSFLDNLPSTTRYTISSIDADTSSTNTYSLEYTEPADSKSTESQSCRSEQDDSNDSQELENITEFHTPSSSRQRPYTKNKNSEERMKLLRQLMDKQPEDETDLFFASMVKIVKKLPEADRAKIRLQIANLVTNAELKYIRSKTVSIVRI